MKEIIFKKNNKSVTVSDKNTMIAALSKLSEDFHSEITKLDRMYYLRMLNVVDTMRDVYVVLSPIWDSSYLWFSVIYYGLSQNTTPSVISDLGLDDITVYLDDEELPDDAFTFYNEVSDQRGDYAILFSPLLPRGQHTVFIKAVNGYSEDIIIQL